MESVSTSLGHHYRLDAARVAICSYVAVLDTGPGAGKTRAVYLYTARRRKTNEAFYDLLIDKY